MTATRAVRVTEPAAARASARHPMAEDPLSALLQMGNMGAAAGSAQVTAGISRAELLQAPTDRVPNRAAAPGEQVESARTARCAVDFEKPPCVPPGTAESRLHAAPWRQQSFRLSAETSLLAEAHAPKEGSRPRALPPWLARHSVPEPMAPSAMGAAAGTAVHQL